MAKPGSYIRTPEVKAKNAKNWNNGVWTEGRRKNHGKLMSRVLTGKPRLKTRGNGNHNWRGGISRERDWVRLSPEYKLWRKAVFQRDHYTCRFCGKHGGDLHADHIKPWILFPELRYAIDNGRTLCVPCHQKTPTWGRPYRVLAKEN